MEILHCSKFIIYNKKTQWCYHWYACIVHVVFQVAIYDKTPKKFFDGKNTMQTCCVIA